jgi:parvulin-like peptidyl-prolyl isomerase
MAQSKTPKIVTKKHLARLERERRQTRAIVIVAIVILSIVVLSIVYGALDQTLFTNYKTIATVNDETVTVREYIARAKAAREQLVDQYMYYYQMAMMFGMDPSTDASLGQLFTDIQNQLDYPENLANQVLTYIEDDLLIKQYGIAHGIMVTEQDVQDAIQSTYKFYPEGSPTPTSTATSFAYSTLSAAQLVLVTATPTLEPSLTPTLVPTITATLPGTPVPSSTPMLTVTPFTEEGFTALYQDALDHYKNLGFSEEMFRRIFFEYALYRERVKAEVTASVPHSVEKVWARHILVADLATAETVHTLLMAGGDFGALAAAYSTDGSASSGGDLGWFSSDTMVAEFSAAAFALPVGEISQPVQTQFGFHIIQVLGHEDRPLTADEYDTAVDDAYTVFLEGLRAEAVISVHPKYLTWIPTKPTLQDAFNDMFSTQTVQASTYEAEQATVDAMLALTPSSTPLPPTATP